MEFKRLVQAIKYQSKESNPGKPAPDHWRVCCERDEMLKELLENTTYENR